LFAVFACRKAKSETGFLEFREALKISFGIMVLTSLFTTVFSYVLFNFIDTAFAESFMQVMVERTQKWMENFGTPQDQIDKAIKKMMTENQFSGPNLFKSFMIGCIVSFLIALIIAAIVKKNKPEFDS
jgi:ABC-type antimicrobial peptide transport system permease subunit